MFPPRYLPLVTNHCPPSIHGEPEHAGPRIAAAYVISVIELPLFSYHGRSDACFSRLLAGDFTHRSVSVTVPWRKSSQAGFVAPAISSPPGGQRLVPVGPGSALLAHENIATFPALSPAFRRNCVASRPCRAPAAFLSRIVRRSGTAEQKGTAFLAVISAVAYFSAPTGTARAALR